MTFSKSRPVTILEIQEDPTTPQPSSSTSYWSWTFGLTTSPFFLWGCPFYLLTGRKFLSSSLPPAQPISDAMTWWRAILDCTSVPLTSILSVFLLIPTVLINGFVLFVFGRLFNDLFIAGTYKITSFYEVLDLVRYLPVVVPLDYVWVRGFKINNIVNMLNNLYGVHDGVGCGSGFRVRLLGMIVAVILIHTLRYFSYVKSQFDSEKSDVWTLLEDILEFSLDIFCSLLLPLYCSFCYAVRFQLYVIKAFIYKLIGQRVLPNIGHLSVVKKLYTQAADSINAINGFFSTYLSAALLILIMGTIVDAEFLGKGFENLFATGLSPLASLITMTTSGGSEGHNKTKEEMAMSPYEVRQINANIACILLIYGLIFFTVRQAISTNDCVRELNVWLNDFVTGGGGTDVMGVLGSLGALTGGKEQTKKREDSTHQSDEMPLVWAKSRIMDNGMDDEFLSKFRNLKAYIHVRMQLEKPALLKIALVGLLAPSLSGRLKNYKLVF